MKVHELKILPEHFSDVWNGIKKFELRKNDRDFKKDDVLHLREYNEKEGVYSGKEVLVDVTNIMYGGVYGLSNDYCIMSTDVFRRIDNSDLPF